MSQAKFKVSKTTEISKLAGAISNTFRNDEADEVKITSIGIESLQRAVKAIASANNFLGEDGDINIVATPLFETIDLGERTITAISHIIRKA